MSDSPKEIMNLYVLETSNRESYHAMKTLMFRQGITNFIPIQLFLLMFSSAH